VVLGSVVTASDLLAVVRVHADRVHDAVRRLGCGPQAALEVVGGSGLDLVDALARDPEQVGDPIGWWFARARALGRQAIGSEQDDLPVGGGLLRRDANQVRLAEALEARPERDRAALLLRDSYDLPLSAVGTALGLDAGAAAEVVGRARLAFLPSLVEGPVPSLDGHRADLGALSRLAESGPVATRDATTRRHAQSCDRCASIIDAQERARRLLSGLTVVALPEADRERLLSRIERRARAVLPAAVAVAPQEAEPPDEPRRLLPLPVVALGLLLATAAGAGIGFYESRSPSTTPIAVLAPAPASTSAAATPPPVVARPAATPPTPTPTDRVPVDVITITPSPSPIQTPTPQVSDSTSPSPPATPSATGTPSSTPGSDPLTLLLNPAAGPNGTAVQVTGSGWQPGATVTVRYLGPRGADTGSTARAVVDTQGRFSTTLTARDPNRLPGRHSVRADDGTHSDRAVFTASG